MDQIIEVFHLDLKIFVAQLLNFGIVFVVLYFFGIKPMVKNMQKRTDTIEKGLKNAEEFDAKLDKLADEKKKIISDAKKEAQLIVTKSQKLAQDERDEALEKTRAQIETLIGKAKKDVANIKKQAISEIKDESMDLVLDVTKKVLGNAIDIKLDKKVVEKHLKEVK